MNCSSIDLPTSCTHPGHRDLLRRDRCGGGGIRAGRGPLPVILSNVVASQVELHAQYGGVFPEVASRQHIRAIYPIIDQALQQAHLGLEEVDAIAVTRGPGLPGSLVVGMNAAKGLALGSGLPLVGINHLEAHLYSAFLQQTGSKPIQRAAVPTGGTDRLRRAY